MPWRISTQKWMAFEYVILNCRCFWKHNLLIRSFSPMNFTCCYSFCSFIFWSEEDPLPTHFCRENSKCSLLILMDSCICVYETVHNQNQYLSFCLPSRLILDPLFFWIVVVEKDCHEPTVVLNTSLISEYFLISAFLIKKLIFLSLCLRNNLNEILCVVIQKFFHLYNNFYFLGYMMIPMSRPYLFSNLPQTSKACFYFF